MVIRASERGSVIIYILIAVVLFAALATAISRTGRGGVTGPNQDINRLEASDILQYARTLHTAAQAMQIDGVADTQISFDATALTGYANSSCTTISCKMFQPTGGGASYITPLPKWFDTAQSGEAGYGTWIFSGANMVHGVGTDDGTAASADLVAILPYITHDLCMQINLMLSIASANNAPPHTAQDVDLADKFTGVYTSTQTIGNGDPEINGQLAGCFQGNGNPPAGTYHFYQVLIAR